MTRNAPVDVRNKNGSDLARSPSDNLILNETNPVSYKKMPLRRSLEKVVNFIVRCQSGKRSSHHLKLSTRPGIRGVSGRIDSRQM